MSNPFLPSKTTKADVAQGEPVKVEVASKKPAGLNIVLPSPNKPTQAEKEEGVKVGSPIVPAVVKGQSSSPAVRPLDNKTAKLDAKNKKKLDREHSADGSPERRGSVVAAYSQIVFILSTVGVMGSLLYDEINAMFGWGGQKFLLYLIAVVVVMVTVFASIVSNTIYSFLNDHDLGGVQGYKVLSSGGRVAFFGGVLFMAVVYKAVEWLTGLESITFDAFWNVFIP